MSRGGTGSVLIVSASAGAGHVSAGNALLEAFAGFGSVTASHVDVLELAPRWVRTAYSRSYELMASRAPRLWRGVYEWSDGPDCDTARWGPVVQRLLFRGFRQLLLDRPWTACICTHFLPGQLAAGRPGHPPFSMVVTDFEMHRYWVQPRVGQYFVASDEMAQGLRARLPGAVVHVTGIPIAPAAAPDRNAARRSLGIDLATPVALVMGGGLGIGIEDAALGALGAAGVQVVAVCGRNERARQRLCQLGVPDSRLRVLGYVDGIERYMAAADVIVSKPGGVSCSEVLARGRPLVLTRAIPGHEEANVRFLTAAGAAISAPARDLVAPALRRLLGDTPDRRNALAAARRLGAPHAARAIAERVLYATSAPVAA
jgi:processive 1,2-diacylglycerol beta-glucosyltransferase